LNNNGPVYTETSIPDEYNREIITEDENVKTTKGIIKD